MTTQTVTDVPRRPRVLMTTSVYPRNKHDATPPFVRHLAEGMVEIGWEVAVLARHGLETRIREDEGALRIRRFPYAWPIRLQRLCYEGGMLVNLRHRPWTKSLLPGFFAAQLAATTACLYQFRPDILHSHSLLPQGFTALLANTSFARPHVTTCHGNDVFGLKPTGTAGRAKRWVLGHTDAVTVNSTVTAEAALAQGARLNRLHRIPAVPGVPAQDRVLRDTLRARWGRTTPVIVFAGRLIAEKGIGELIDAVGRMQKDRTSLRLVVIGDGADRAVFENRIQCLAHPQNVEFTGWLSSEKVQTHMAAADLVVVPSRPGPGGWKEAQGLVAVEAMAARTAVVASAFGGLTDMIEDGKTGYLCPPGDADALATTLSRALDDDARVGIVANAYAHFESEFSASAVVRSTDALYRQLLEGNRL